MRYQSTVSNANPDKLSEFQKLIHDLRATRRELDIQTSHFRALIETSTDCVTTLSMDGTILDVNAAGLAIFEAGSPEEMRGRSLSPLVVADHREAYEEFLEKAIRGSGSRMELEIVGHNGTPHRLEVRSVPLRDPDSNVCAILLIAHDFAQRRRAEQFENILFEIADAANTVNTLDDLFRSVHEIIGRGIPVRNFYIALYDDTEDIITFPYFVDEVDVPSPPAKPGRGLTEYVLRTGKSLLCNRAMDDALVLRGEVDLVGIPSPIWLGVPLVVNSKTIGTMVVQHYSDPTAYGPREQHLLEYVSAQVAKAIERKRDEQELRESQERYRSFIENARDVIFTVGKDATITCLNPAFEKITGWPSSEWVGRSFTSLIHPEDLSRALQTFERSMRGEAPALYQLRVLCSSGEYVVGEFQCSASVVDGRIVGVIGVVRDVSQRVKLEEQLRHAQKLESLGTLAGGIAHDFNNILGIILGHASLLHRSLARADNSITSLDAITQAVQRGSGLVRQLLTFARTSEVTFEPVHMNTIVKEFVKMFHATFPKTITLSLQLEENLPFIRADVNQLNQVLLNLTINARDAMPRGGILTIRTSTVAGTRLRGRFPEAIESQHIALSISDTGTGIDESTRLRIFEPFFTTKDVGEGTGLGLSVVYGVVSSHSAFIDVESTPGVGTTFHLYFQASEEVTPLPATPPLRFADGTLNGTETILLVEDEEMLRNLILTLLRSSGYSVITAENGIEALERYRQFHNEISVVLTDIGLPKMSGWDAFREMKKINPNLKAIFASGYLEPKIREDIINHGGKYFVQKPYVPADLLKKLRDTIESR